MSFRLGLTGSIGMGKSTTTKLFADEGCAIWNADDAVHRLYGRGGAAVEPLRALCPQAVDGESVSRPKLKELIIETPDLLTRIERIVHPLVAADRQAFLEACEAEIVVFDIPLLFENGTEALMDAVVCVSVDAETQKSRVMARGTMDEAQFNAILSRQLPDTEKRERSDYVIITDTPEHARAQVHDILRDIRYKISQNDAHA